jgi:hypothetical protein
VFGSSVYLCACGVSARESPWIWRGASVWSMKNWKLPKLGNGVFWSIPALLNCEIDLCI